MCGCESWTIKKAGCWRTDVFKLWYCRRILRVSDCKEIKPVNLKGNQPWVFIGRTDGEAEAPTCWPPDVSKEPTHWKSLRCWERLRPRGEGWWEDEKGGWHHSINGREFKQTQGDSEEEGSLLQSIGLQSLPWHKDWTTTATFIFQQ